MVNTHLLLTLLTLLSIQVIIPSCAGQFSPPVEDEDVVLLEGGGIAAPDGRRVLLRAKPNVMPVPGPGWIYCWCPGGYFCKGMKNCEECCDFMLDPNNKPFPCDCPPKVSCKGFSGSCPACCDGNPLTEF